MATKERTTKQVVDDTRMHLRELVDAHVELAKAEMAQTQRQLTAAVARLAVAGVLALYVIGFLGVTAAKGLDNYVTEGWAWLIVSGAVTLVVVVLGLLGVRRLQRLEATPERTQESIRETMAWARAKTGRDS